MQGLDLAQLRELVIKPTLDYIGMGGPAAEEQILGTIIQESGAHFLHQLGGPAITLGQLEPATIDDINVNFLAYRPDLRRKVLSFASLALSVIDQLPGNLHLTVVYMRLKYARSADPMPAAGDLDGQAHFWKTTYNTAGGAGTEDEYRTNWRARFPQTV